MSNKRIISSVLYLCICLSSMAGIIDTTKYVVYQRYDCANDSTYGHLIIPGSRKYIDIFQDKLTRLADTGNERINILHIGGSHVQAGSYPHKLRTDFTSICPAAAGDRGLVFPFKAMKTNAPANYSFTHTGEWAISRCISKELDAVLGIAGAAVITKTPDCSLTLDLKDDGKWTFRDIRLLGYSQGENAVTPYIICDSDTILADKSDSKTGFLFHMPKDVNGCTVGFTGLDSLSSFVVRGMLPMSNRKGITYTESGVNGAATFSWLKCEAFQEEMSLLPPDLVIFGIGINDAAVKKFNTEKFKNNYRKIITNLRRINPNVAFIFITNNDCRFLHTKTCNPNSVLAQQAFMELAKENDGCVFDVFQLMGGLKSSDAWRAQELMEPDQVHFTRAGYELLGDILYNAIIEDNINRQK